MNRLTGLPAIEMVLLLTLAVGEAKAQYQLSIVAKTGDTIGGKILNNIYPENPSLNNTGIVAFQGSYSGGSGIFTQNALIAKTGDTISGLTLTDFGDSCSVNNAGIVEFVGMYSGGSGIFTQNGAIAKTGDTIGSHTLKDVSDLGDRKMNNAGDVAFLGDYTYGNGIRFAIFSQDSVLVTPGDTIGGVKINGFGNGPFLNDMGTVAFHGNIASGGSGIFTQNSIIAKPGDIIEGLTLTDVGSDPALNDVGTVVFYGTYSGGSGLFTQHSVIAKTGDVIGGKTISGFIWSATTTTNASVNDAGDIAFYATFGDGSKGIILAQSIPEPSAIILLGIGAIWLLGYRWSQSMRKRYSD